MPRRRQPRSSSAGWAEGLSSVDANGTRWGQDVDGFGREIRATVTPPGGTPGVVSTTSYGGFVDDDPAGRTIVTTTFTDPDAQGQTSYAFLDELGRTRRVERKLGADYSDTLIELSRQFDDRGRLSFEADPYPTSQDGASAYGTTYHYNGEGMLECSIRGNGPQPLTTTSDPATERFPTCFDRTFEDHAVHLSVQGPDALLSGSPQAGVVRTDTTSAIGWLLSRETRDTPNGTRLELSTYAHDRLGQLTALSRFADPASSSQSAVWTWSLDSSGQTLSATEPGVDPRAFSYSDWGELAAVDWTDSTTQATKRLEYDYDALSRMTSSAELENGAVLPDTHYSWIYDQVQDPSVLDSTYVAGRLSATTSPIGDMHLSYDAFGRVDTRVFVDPDGQQYRERTEHRLDGAPSVLELRLPDTEYQSEKYIYAYDSASRLRSVRFQDDHADKTLYDADDLDPFGRVRHAVYGENITYTATHAEIGRRLPLKETVQVASGGSRVITYGTYDPIGRELARREDRDGTTGPITTNTYDVVGRLHTSVQAVTGSPAQFDTSFTYDPLGNLRHLGDSVDSSQVSLSFDTLDRDRLCRIDYGPANSGCNVIHDGSGNVVHEPTRGGGSRAITYFPSGAVRSIKTSTHVTAAFRRDGSGEIAELDVHGPTDSRSDRRYGLIQRRNVHVNGGSQSILVRQIPGAGGLVASRRGADGPFVFPFADGRGTRFAATNDPSQFVQDVGYRPFGEAGSTLPPGSPEYTPDQWNGGDALADLGLVNLGARLYDPVIGRFLSRDPLIVARTASTTNPYAFAFNDPINGGDPSGLDPGLGICATSWGGPCGSDPSGDSAPAGIVSAAATWLIGRFLDNRSSSNGPAGPSLLSKDAYDTTPITFPKWEKRDFLDHFAGTMGLDTFDDYAHLGADQLDAAARVTDSIPTGIAPIAGTATLFLHGESQLLRGIGDERQAARRLDVAGMQAARNQQAIGLGKALFAILSVVAAPLSEVGAAARTEASVS